MFLREWISRDHKVTFEKIESRLYDLEFDNEELNGEEVQSLFVHLAYYFVRIGDQINVSACFEKISNRYFKLRLQAWQKTRKYHNYAEHIKQFSSYLQLLTNAQDEVDDANVNELLSDLTEYLDYADKHLSINYRRELSKLTVDDSICQRFPLLEQYHRKSASDVPGLEVVPYDGREFEPSDFALSFFEERFLSEIRQKSQPGFSKVIFGYPALEVRNYVVGRGQADFDKKFGNLTGRDRVNLYCYFNMRMHFFSSLSLIQRSTIAERFYNTAGKIKFIDIGCGPATSGLALADYIHKTTGEESFFDYYGIDIADSMLEKADEMLTNRIFADSNTRLFFSSIKNLESDELKNASCIVINCCYVFASPSLDYEELAKYITNISGKYPYLPKYLLYQNVTEESMNINYLNFKYQLGNYVSEWSGREKIKYHNQQNSFYPAKEREVYYEILKLQ